MCKDGLGLKWPLTSVLAVELPVILSKSMSEVNAIAAVLIRSSDRVKFRRLIFQDKANFKLFPAELNGRCSFSSSSVSSFFASKKTVPFQYV